MISKNYYLKKSRVNIKKGISAKGTKIKKGVTLMETLIIIIIISVLVTLSTTYLIPSRERVADKEAISNLKVIQSAERSYRLDAGNYYPSLGSISNIATINQELKLSLRGGPQRNWDYTVFSTGCAQATRNGGDGRSWYLTINDADGEPDSGAGCP